MTWSFPWRSQKARRQDLLRRMRRAVPSPASSGPDEATSDSADRAAKFAIPLSWVATTKSHPYTNLGDALSAVVVASIAGLPVCLANFDENCERLVAVGTIGHHLRNGIVHFWGTGLDAKRNAVESPLEIYVRPPMTEFRVHAMRGKFSAQALRDNGIDAPPVYGDPVWFLPRLFPRPSKPDTELGVIVHISELTAPNAEATVRANLRRYEIPPELASSIRIINTYTEPTLAGLRAKVLEIASCKRILSTSLHGMVIAETYGIPCSWFATYAGGDRRLAINELEGERIDHRIRDFYSGVERESVLAYCQDRREPTDWTSALRHLDTGWEPLSYDGEALFEAFPLPRAVRFADNTWPVDEGLMSQIKL